MAEGRVVIGPGEGVPVIEGGLGVVLKLSGVETGDSFSIVEHPMEPGVLAAPPHTHANEDEFSFVVEGTVGVLMGEEVYEAGPGSYVLKPRGVPHTFWNAGPEPVRIVEIISPAGFERYFEELAKVLSAGRAARHRQDRRDRRPVRADFPLGADGGALGEVRGGAGLAPGGDEVAVLEVVW